MIYRFFIYLCLLGMLLPQAAYAGEKLNSELDEELVYEATIGSATRVAKLLEQGANPNALTPEGWTALAVAANRIDDEAFKIVKLLVAAGADINGGKKGYSPIVNAAHNSNKRVAMYLISHGADPDSTDRNGKNLIWIADHVRMPELRAAIEEIYAKRKQQEKSLRSEENLKKLAAEYSFALCEARYWAFYLASGQDPNLDRGKLKNYINKRLKDANDTGRTIAKYFPNLDREGFARVTSGSQALVKKQLESLVSNRNRKKHGVGTEEDMRHRCSKISSLWDARLRMSPAKSK